MGAPRVTVGADVVPVMDAVGEVPHQGLNRFPDTGRLHVPQ